MVRLESPLPEALPAGRAGALFLSGSGSEGLRSLAVTVDGIRHPAAAAGMLRPDLGSRGGWWASVPYPAVPAGETVRLGAAGHELAALPVAPLPAPPATPLPGPEPIVVCMATYEPDEALLRAQVESLRAQTDDDWLCVVSDDASSGDALERVVGDDPRFVVSRAAT